MRGRCLSVFVSSETWGQAAECITDVSRTPVDGAVTSRWPRTSLPLLHGNQVHLGLLEMIPSNNILIWRTISQTRAREGGGACGFTLQNIFKRYFAWRGCRIQTCWMNTRHYWWFWLKKTPALTWSLQTCSTYCKPCLAVGGTHSSPNLQRPEKCIRSMNGNSCTVAVSWPLRRFTVFIQHHFATGHKKRRPVMSCFF